MADTKIFSQALHLSAVQGADEQRSETYGDVR